MTPQAPPLTTTPLDAGAAREPSPRGWPVWWLGFRPFYLGAALFGTLAIPLWIFQLLGIWPVQPAPGRFTVQGEAQSQQIAPDNAARYSAVVQWVESVDLQRAVALYARLYPLFQQAYEELGYPGRYFNDRVVAVIDHLLAAPEPAAPVRVQLTEVKGEWSSARPWVRYEFADPQLQALSSGQKIMVRVGLENERRLKVRLKAAAARPD